MTMDEWQDMIADLAQLVINIDSGYTTVESGSRCYTALVRLMDECNKQDGPPVVRESGLEEVTLSAQICSTVGHALRVAAERYQHDATDCRMIGVEEMHKTGSKNPPEGWERMAQQFDRQQTEVIRLASMIENADEMVLRAAHYEEG